LAGGASDSITSPQLFGFAMRSVVQTLIAKGAKGCIATIPDITTIPFFTTIPYNGLVLTKNQADSIMMFMTLFHLPFKFQAGANPFLIEDQNIPVLHCRQARANDLILLTVPPDSLKCKGMGIINPLTLQLNPIPNQFVLDSVEVALIKNSTEIYNDSIRNLATNYHIALVDINTKLHDIVTGIIWDGIQLNSKFVSGGTFSTDGIHLTPRGNAVAANYFIEAINGYYGCNIPEVNITSYKGLKFP